MLWMRKRKDERRSLEGSKSQESEAKNFGHESVQNTIAVREDQQVETETRRINSEKGLTMHHKDILNDAITTINQRGNEYGDAHPMFVRAANIASALTDRKFTAYDMAIAMMAVKMSRIANNREHHDSWVDLVAYSAFAGQFSKPTTSDFDKIVTAQVEAELMRQIGEDQK